ncbi:SDR family oxidoreductase [Maribacter algicola]|uniref:SDR family oxidoreductase n=1 Tax=Meishania litoralis TaxID=3434685 RepID=A0ACC7LK25_9FLAO
MNRINGKTVWITGASSGIGEALAYALSARDCNLIISSRKEVELLRVKNKCHNPEKVSVIPLDLEITETMTETASKAIAEFGKIDILINNAGISQRSYIIDTKLEVYKKLMEINYLGTVGITKAVLPHFISQQAGHFVTVTSLMGKFGAPPRSGYCGSKHALHGFFDVLRLEHEKDGIDVTMVCPGYVDTNVAKNALTGDGSAQGTDDIENKNGLQVDLVAKKMILAIEMKKHEKYMGGKEVIGVYLKRFFPRLLHRFVLRKTEKKSRQQ